MNQMREKVYSHIASYATPSDLRGGIEFFGTLGAWTAMFWAPWWCIPLHALLSVRLFVVGVHDPGHMTLFRTPAYNDYALQLAGPLLCMPGMGWWRPLHNEHHQHSNDLDYNQNAQTAFLTVAKYRRMSGWKQSLFRYFTRPMVFVTQTAPLLMTVGQLIHIASTREFLFQCVAFVVLYPVMLRYIIQMAIASSIGVFMFHLQHTFPECVRVKGKDFFENGFYGSSFLQVPRWMRIFTAGIEYHHIHHLSSRVPSYRLRACHDAAPPGMWDGIRVITFREGWDALNLAMWSVEKNRLVTFEEVDAEKLLT
jgi:omega-6 fatty acid desaturase (delta-12 desaturase)